MNINPCLFMPQNWVIAFYRKCLASAMLIELFFLLCLRLLSFCCKINNLYKQQDSPHIKEDNMMKIEVIQQSAIEAKSSMPFSMQGSQLFILPTTKRTKNQSRQQNNQSLQQTVKIKVIQTLPKAQEQSKVIIQIKNLVLHEKDMRNIICIELGHQFICIAIAIMYYPFAYTAIICVAQMLLFITHYLFRIFSENLLTKVTKVGLFLLNIGLMSLSIYGLCSNIPQLKLNSCFDL